MGKVSVTMTIDKKLLDSFRSYCMQNGMKMSPTVETMMEKAVMEAEE